MAHASWDSTGGGIPRPPSAMTSPRARSRSRAQSISSDRPSTSGYSLMAPPVVVSPPAAFIAASAASQIVTNDHDNHANQWYDQYGIEPSGETAVVTDAALQLVNNFLDQLLFGFLSLARSASLSALRPAVTEVLKPKLAKDAISQADEELREYLGGGDDEDMLTSQTSFSPNDWDLELVWKRTRLRCMVYSSLGDMEEEDEDYYMEQENLDGGVGSDGDGGEALLGETVSPAVAIFLTSILEFMGEQALTSAGQAAFQRTRFLQDRGRKANDDSAAGPEPMPIIHVAERIVVDEVDMERVAFDRTIGRLWRAWKKRIRIASPSDALQPRSPLDFVRSSHSLRQPSLDEEGLADSYHHGGATRDAISLKSPASTMRTTFPDTPEGTDHARASSTTTTTNTTTATTTMTTESAKTDGDWLAAAVATPLPANPGELADLLFPVSSDDKSAAATGRRPKSVLMPFFVAEAASGHHKRASSQPAAPRRAYVPEGGDENKDVSVPSSEAAPPSSPSQKKKPPPLWSVQPPTVIGAAITTAHEQAVSVSASSVHNNDGVSEPGDEEEDDIGDIDEIDDIDDFAEEAQIMTSSRVSISGLSNSPPVSENNYVVSIVPTRSSSIRSQRVIDVVPTPRQTGGARSRNESPEFNARGAANNPSRSISSQRIAEESSAAAAAAEPALAPPQKRGVVAPASPKKLNVVDASSTPSTFFHDDDDEPEAPSKEKQAKVAVPERSAKRQEALAASSAAAAAAAASVVTTTTTTTTTTVVVRASGTRSEMQPPSPSLVTDRSSSVSSGRDRDRDRDHARDHHRAQLRPDVEPVADRKQSVASIPSSITKLSHKRSSEESSAVMRPEDVARNFEQLIHSDETIQYTLTPEGMRDVESSRSIYEGNNSSIVKGRKSDDGGKSQALSRSSSVNHNHNSRAEGKRSMSVARSRTDEPPPPPTAASSSTMPGGGGGGGAPAMYHAPSKSRGPPPQAREARVAKESLTDFADFIRETGPPKSAAAASAPPPPPQAGAVRNMAAKPKATPPSTSSSAPSPSARPRPRFEARSAAVNLRDDNSELIEFIRRGPPPSSIKNRRISRNMALFRPTTDFDPETGVIGGGGSGHGGDASAPSARYSGTSTNVTESSMGSSAALVKKGAASHAGTGNSNGMSDMPPGGMPKRKTRRVRDPYAIDLTDEEEELEAELMGGSRHAAAPPKEESLIDFLNSVPPPPSNYNKPVPFSIAQKPASKPPPVSKKSTSSFMSRFTRRNSTSRKAAASSSNGSQSGGSSVFDARSTASRAGSVFSSSNNVPPLPTSSMPANMEATFGTSISITAAHSANAKLGRTPMKKFEPREAKSVSSRATQDMADFFRNSGPPQSFRG